MAELAEAKIEKSKHPPLSLNNIGKLGKGTENINTGYSLKGVLLFVKNIKGLNQNVKIETKPKDSLSVYYLKHPEQSPYKDDPWKSFILITSQLKDEEPKKRGGGGRLELYPMEFLARIPIKKFGAKTSLNLEEPITLEVELSKQELNTEIKQAIVTSPNDWIINNNSFVERTLEEVMERYKKPAGAKV